MRILSSLFISLLSMHGFSQASFIEQDLKKAQEKAKAQNKMIFIDFYTDWCTWCKVMDEKTFQNPSVSAALNEDFVPVRIDAEEGIGIALALKYRLTGYPSYAFLSPDGDLVMQGGGYQKTDAFSRLMDQAKAKNQAKDFVAGVSNDLDMEFPDFLKDYIARGKEATPYQRDIEAYLNSETDLSQEIPFMVMSKFGVPASVKEKVLSKEPRMRELYGDDPVDKVVSALAWPEIRQATRTKDKDMLDGTIAMLKDHVPSFSLKHELSVRIKFCDEIGNMKGYAANVTRGMDNGVFEALQLASYAEVVTEKTKETDILAQAEKWATKAVAEVKNMSTMVTRAEVLRAMGQKDKASAQLKEAISWGEARNKDVSKARTLLGRLGVS